MLGSVGVHHGEQKIIEISTTYVVGRTCTFLLFYTYVIMETIILRPVEVYIYNQ